MEFEIHHHPSLKAYFRPSFLAKYKEARQQNALIQTYD